ncbi:MAG: protocatechuate 4,5-dioxygenase subunit alpha [Actinomycetota bacterium]|nr:protocatechuate 4,5-dioxygenase subunit alpha [Actinomycetota bacterium]
MTRGPRDYDDIPGTLVFDGRVAQLGYALNSFLKTLDRPECRDAFRESEAAYLDRFDLTDDQRAAVLARDWNRLLELGGNIFYIWKLAVFDQRSMQYLGGQMSGMTEEEFRAMMASGGRRAGGIT